MGTKRVTQHKAAPAYGFKALPGEPDGTFEAYVSVFGNVDLGGERVVYGAFGKSLARWEESGDPIPVIFSHQWDTLDAHVGIVLEAEERGPEDVRLPAELAGLGGLYIKGRMDVDEDFAGRLWKRMERRSIREFSFAYDVIKAKPGTAGALDLLELDVIEVGPTLKGMNPTTVLVAAKAAAAGKAIDRESGTLALDLLDVADELMAGLADEAPIVAPLPVAKRLPVTALAPGAVEPILGAIRESATVWAALEYGRDFYALHLEGTYLEDGVVIVTAERWEDPYGEGPAWALAFTFEDDGTVAIGTATELEVTVELSAKRLEARETELSTAEHRSADRDRKAAFRSAGAASSTVHRGGKAEPDGKAEAEGEISNGETERAALEAELIAIDLEGITQ